MNISDDSGPTLDTQSGIDLFWIPLGAGGSGFVRWNGRLYEGLKARLEHRPPLDLYHTALLVRLPETHCIIETMWPSPDNDIAQRGVAVSGPVFSRLLGRLRIFRYEVRRWHNGVLPDAGAAVNGPQTVTCDPTQGRLLLSLVDSVPALVWGRDELQVGDMWNSNSVVSWLLASTGLDMDSVQPPEGGRAPGWSAGLAAPRPTSPASACSA